MSRWFILLLLELLIPFVSLTPFHSQTSSIYVQLVRQVDEFWQSNALWSQIKGVKTVFLFYSRTQKAKWNSLGFGICIFLAVNLSFALVTFTTIDSRSSKSITKTKKKVSGLVKNAEDKMWWTERGRNPWNRRWFLSRFAHKKLTIAFYKWQWIFQVLNTLRLLCGILVWSIFVYSSFSSVLKFKIQTNEQMPRYLI